VRVFEQYDFDLGSNILFKDTLPYVEAWLAEQGIAYHGMALMMCLCSDEDLLNRLLGKYPQLEKYRRIDTGNWEITPQGLLSNGELRPFSYDLSSVPQDWPSSYALHVLREDEALVRELTAKIPRPFNPGAVCIVLDHVRWFPDINTEPAIPEDGEPSGFGACALQSNHIEMVKDFQMGKKHNQVSVKIERTKSPEALLDVSAVVEKLTAAFGAVRDQYLDIVFSPEERRLHQAADEALEPVLQALWAELKLEDAVPKNVPPQYIFTRANFGDGTIDVVSLGQGEPVSPKKAIVKAIKGTGFQYKYYAGGFYECKKRTKYNHLIELSFSQKTMSRHFNCYLGISGFNFRVGVPLATGIDIMRQSVVEEAVQGIVKLSLQIEERLTEPLARAYGKTPDWYQ